MGLFEKKKRKKSRTDGVHESRGKAEAERLVVEGLAALGISSAQRDLEGMRKGDEAKVMIAALLRSTTAVGNGWIAERLSMGHPGSVSRLVVGAGKDAKHDSKLKKLKKLLECGT